MAWKKATSNEDITLKAVYDPNHARHNPAFFLVRGQITENKEIPARADALLEGLRAGNHELTQPQPLGRDPAAAVHTPEYLGFLEQAYSAWRALPNASSEVIPNVHPASRPASYPRSIVGRAGWHMQDTACPIGEHTFAAALRASEVAATAAALVAAGERAAYALCRPCGHHAYADRAGGFCYLNNTAIAAEYLRRFYARVAVLDVDLHHGNGTQGIFYHRRDVLTLSVHADPADFYPFFWGHKPERGAGAGEGANFNYPLALGSGDDAFLDALSEACRIIRGYAPQALVIAAGLDASSDDPFGALALSSDGFNRIGQAIAELGLATVFVQEGGYLSPTLGANLTELLGGFERSA